MGKARLTPQQIADKQVSRAQQAVPDYTAGVAAVTVAPNSVAASKVDKYQNGVNAAVQSGKYVSANQAVTLSAWQTAAKGKGARNYAQGVADAKPKILAFQQAYAPVRNAIADQVNAMPDDTFEQRLAKADQNARLLHAQPYKGS
jgi:hypothetical protein